LQTQQLFKKNPPV